MKLTIRNVRLTFPKLWKAESFANDPTSKPAFSCSFLISPDDPQIAQIQNAIQQVAFDLWQDKAQGILAELYGKDKTCLHNGDYKADYDGYAGMWYVTARSKNKPLVIDRDTSVLTEESGRPYGGCYGNVSIDIYAQDDFGKRVNASLRGVQFVQDGDAFSGGPPAKPEEFDNLGVSGDALA